MRPGSNHPIVPHALFVVVCSLALPATSGVPAVTGSSVAEGSVRRDVPPDVLFGSVLARAPDLDRDGCDDLLVADPGTEAAPSDPRVWLMSGRNGAVLAGRRTRDYAAGTGVALAAGADVDGDGVFDWAFACGFEEQGSVGRVVIVSGSNDLDLAVIEAPAGVARFGTKIHFLRTTNGEVELLVRGRDAHTGEPLVTVHAARDGRCLRSWPLNDDVVEAGLEFLPDHDGDGREDIVSAQRDHGSDELLLNCISTRDGSLVSTLRWPRSAHTRYYRLATCPDLDGDRVEETILTRDARVECRWSSTSGVITWAKVDHEQVESVVVARTTRTRAARVVVVADSGYGIAEGRVQGHDPWTGELLWARDGGEDDWHLGYALVPIGDADRDGVEDVAVANWHLLSGTPGRFSVLSGKTGKLLRTMKRRGATLGHA